ncbi:Beta-phosphoglucomutase [compost metagenome]
MDSSEILPGALSFLKECREAGIKVALGSASKNAMTILNNTGLTPYFDAIIDGTHTSSAKPDPEVFLLGAQAVGIAPEQCVVFEDAEAGILAATRAGMSSVGIGSPATLTEANFVVPSLAHISVATLREWFATV